MPLKMKQTRPLNRLKLGWDGNFSGLYQDGSRRAPGLTNPPVTFPRLVNLQLTTRSASNPKQVIRLIARQHSWHHYLECRYMLHSINHSFIQSEWIDFLFTIPR